MRRFSWNAGAVLEPDMGNGPPVPLKVWVDSSTLRLEVSHVFPMENQEECSMLENVGKRTPLIE